MPRRSGAFDERPLRRVTPALLRSLATKKTCRCSSLVYALLKTQQTAPERKRNASEADKQQANKGQTIVIRTAGGSTCPAATRLLRKPGRDPDHSPTTFFPNENSSTKSTRSDFHPTEMSSMRKVEDTKGRRYEVYEIRSLRDPKSA